MYPISKNLKKAGKSFSFLKESFMAHYFNRNNATDIIIPTKFELKLRTHFERMQQNPQKNVFLVWLKTDSTDYEFGVVSMGQNPWDKINYRNNNGMPVVAALDLKRPFGQQWPAEQIETPHQLFRYPIIEIPHERDINPASDGATPNNLLGYAGAPRPHFIRGVISL